MDDDLGALRCVELSGRDAMEAATALLLAARGDDPMAGSYEAGDVHWWWATADERETRRGTFWFGPDGLPVAALLEETAPDPPGSASASAIDIDLIWRPTADEVVRPSVFPAFAARLAAISERRVSVEVEADDHGLRRLLEAAGFRHDTAEDLLLMWQRPTVMPPPVPLPAGFRFDDARFMPASQPHHLAKRSGERVAERLAETPLYRPNLDLCVRADDGQVAAYCLCWLDAANRVGLFEPVRTEDAFQRRGLGRAILTEGIRRMLAAGADLIKVICERSNPAARGLYERVGFEAGSTILVYARP